MARRALELSTPMADLPPVVNHYELLGVTPGATMDEIQAAYATRRSAIEAAPPAGDTDADPVGALLALQLAHAVLSDAQRRRVYDAFLVSHEDVMRRAARWWRRPAARRALGAGLAMGLMLALVAGVGALVWRLQA